MGQFCSHFDAGKPSRQETTDLTDVFDIKAGNRAGHRTRGAILNLADLMAAILEALAFVSVRLIAAHSAIRSDVFDISWPFTAFAEMATGELNLDQRFTFRYSENCVLRF